MQRTNNGFGKNATVISENDGTKINKNLDIAKSVYETRSNNTKGFITDIARALGLAQHESSQYGTFVTPNGKTLILNSLQKMLQTGEYVDTTGLAHVEEVNKIITPKQSRVI